MQCGKWGGLRRERGDGVVSEPTEYTEGVCGDGAAILRDGQPIPITEILSRLNRLAHLEFVICACCDAIRDNDEFAALRMLEVALTRPGVGR